METIEWDKDEDPQTNWPSYVGKKMCFVCCHLHHAFEHTTYYTLTMSLTATDACRIKFSSLKVKILEFLGSSGGHWQSKNLKILKNVSISRLLAYSLACCKIGSRSNNDQPENALLFGLGG